MKIGRRRAQPRIYPPYGKQGPKNIEVLLWHDFRPLQIIAKVISCHVQIMISAGDGRIELWDQTFYSVYDFGMIPVNDRRSEPFKEWRIGLAQELQRLSNIPAA